MSRNRSHCVIKKNSLKSGDQEQVPEHISLHPGVHIEENKNNKNLDNENFLSVASMKKPIFKNLPKKFPSKLNKNIFFHEKGQLMNCFEKHLIGDIDKHTVTIDFERFLLQFKNEEEIRNLELHDILDIDYDQLNEIKTKATEFIDVTSSVIYDMEQKGESTATESELLVFFYEKLQEIQSNEINIQIFANNLIKVKGVCYNHNGVKLFFKNNLNKKI